jgi:thiamine-monophosphate kinase
MIDVSDGLAIDLARLARSSGVRVDLERVPVHPDAARAARRDGRSARDHALGDGEDYELLACLPASRADRILVEARRRWPTLVPIGRVRRGSGLWIAGPGAAGGLRRWSGRGGWVHGGRS